MDPVSTARGRQAHRSKAPQRAIASRDAGLELIRRVNRWLLAGAVAGVGFVSLAAAHAFHGHTVTASGAPSSATSPSRQPGSSSSGGSTGLQSPSQAPAPASSGSTGVVSGGS